MAMRRAHFGVGVAAVLGAVHVAVGCGDVSAEAPPVRDAGTESSRPPATIDASRDGARAPREPFEGWGTFDEYEGCNLLVPGSRAALPPALQWTPCPETPQTTGLACRELVLDWTSRSGEWISPGTTAMRRLDGTVALITARHEVDTTYRMIADVDGPVHVAIRENSRQCVLYGGASDGDHYFWAVHDTATTSERHEGTIGGSLHDLIPTVLHQQGESESYVWAAGRPGYFERAPTTRISSWQGGGAVEDFATGQAPRGATHFSGDYLLWSDDTPGGSIGLWGSASDANVLVSLAGDGSRGVSGLVTDGKDLVWVAGSRRGGDDGGSPTVFARVEIVTSPFAVTAAKLRPRVLRSDLSGYAWSSDPVVGCGHFARSGYLKDDGGEERAGILVVRLSDGYAWLLPGGPDVELGWREPLAITCDEIFARVSEKNGDAGYHSNVARVRIDSLGEPMPP